MPRLEEGSMRTLLVPVAVALLVSMWSPAPANGQVVFYATDYYSYPGPGMYRSVPLTRSGTKYVTREVFEPTAYYVTRSAPVVTREVVEPTTTRYVTREVVTEPTTYVTRSVVVEPTTYVTRSVEPVTYVTRSVSAEPTYVLPRTSGVTRERVVYRSRRVTW
jgi:hypothetical protein